MDKNSRYSAFTINYILSKIRKQNETIDNLEKIIDRKKKIIKLNKTLVKEITSIYDNDMKNLIIPHINSKNNIIKYYVDAIKCKSCYNNKMNILFLDCGHICYCESCFNNISQNYNSCPICNSTINSTKKIILPY